MKRCLFCGQMNPDDASSCYCGSTDLEVVEPIEKRVQSTPSSPSKKTSRKTTGSIKTYLVPAILATLFCCMPFGIIAIVYTTKVTAKLEVGEQQEAAIASREALKWCWISFGMGLLSWIVLIVIGNMAGK